MSNSHRPRIEVRSGFVEEPLTSAGLPAAEQLFAKLAVRMLLQETQTPESAGPRLHRRDGRALTPQESGSAKSESERANEQIPCGESSQSAQQSS